MDFEQAAAGVVFESDEARERARQVFEWCVVAIERWPHTREK